MSFADVLRGFGWTVASVGLVCMALYVYLAYHEDERLNDLYVAGTGHSWSWKARWFLIAASLAFLFCIYDGAESMLGWMPASWGSVDEYREFTPLKTTLAGTFALFVGGPLMSVIERAHHYGRENYGLRLRVKELESELRARKLP